MYIFICHSKKKVPLSGLTMFVMKPCSIHTQRSVIAILHTKKMQE